MCVFLNTDLITALYFTLFQYPRENTFPRHNAIAGFIINGAAVVALFADLGNFNQCVFSQSDPGAHRNVFPINAGGGDVFGKIAKGYVKALMTDIVYFFGGQKTHLSMPGAGMGIAFQAMLLL